MKRINRIIKIGLLVLVLAVGFSKTSKAVQQVCFTLTITCPLGGGSNCLICGSTPEEIQQATMEMISVICGGN